MIEKRAEDAITSMLGEQQVTALKMVTDLFERLRKSQPGAPDVHAPTALGNQRGRRDFKSALAERKKPQEEQPTVAEGSVGKKKTVVTTKRFRAVKACPECGVPAGAYHKGDCSGHVLWDVGAKLVGKAAQYEWPKREIEWKLPIRFDKGQINEEQKIYGWASVTQIGDKIVIDKQDDIIDEQELRKAAEEYVLYCRAQGDMHERKGVGRVIQSMVYTHEIEKYGFAAFDPNTGEQKYGWFVGFKVDDPDVWKRIKAGELPEFSIGGKAIRVPV